MFLGGVAQSRKCFGFDSTTALIRFRVAGSA